MVKKSANPWLRTLVRAGKKQQRTVSRALTALLLPKPAPKPRARPTPKPKPPPKAGAGPGPRSTPRKLAATAPAAPASGKWLASRHAGLTGEGNGAMRQMRYWLYLPDQAPGPLPLLVMLHGCDQSATQFAEGTRMNQAADKRGFAVLYPQQSVSAHPHRCWKWYDRATQQGGGDVGLIVGIVRKVMGQYPIDPTRIYIAGISAGAGMANIVALNHPDLFAALGLHSGPMFGAGHSQFGALGVMRHGATQRVDSAIDEVLLKHPAFPAMPTMLIQGEDDDVVRPVNQAHLTRQAMQVNRLHHGTPVKVTTKAGNRNVRAHRLHDVYSGRKLVLRVAQIAALKHAWSGGDARLPYNASEGPDASKMLLDFFAKHRRK
ncbi:PHB depolymerase family esterase [Massilia sp. CF038]|uniref:extracellular catalytic domain type 1 short-chain-length polyhydroxyalkanoate depolymerase n=1 Tax=Massilia sp. CF038 TaxID=1881045 RepID=UPI0009218841|nr:PHB depolymerase family esterase [Massilia sp. CF038]SHG46510.1 esterase, PHB depolymerase family [Massilia sp. CF038]